MAGSLAGGELVNLAFIAAMFALSGLGTQLFGVAKTTAIQRAVPSQVLGRVLSIDFFGSFAALPIGELLGGAIAARTSPETVMKIGGLLVAITTWLPLLASGISSFSNPDTPVRTTVSDTDEQSAPTASDPALGTADFSE